MSSVVDKPQTRLGHHPVLGPSLGGFIAVQMATIVGYGRLGTSSAATGCRGRSTDACSSPPPAQFGYPDIVLLRRAATVIHMVDGVVFAILFVVLVRL